MNLTKLARGKACEIRIPGICNRDERTVVACHYRLGGLSGFGIKSPDLFIAFGCSSCHDAVDGRMKTDWSRDDLLKMHAEGVFRTQLWLFAHGHIRISNRTEAQRVIP